MTPEGLRRAIVQLGVSQRELARMLDYNERTVRHYCAGDLPIPRVVEYAVRWLMTGWPTNIRPQPEVGGSHDEAKV